MIQNANIRSVLLYHLYPKGDWKNITKKLLSCVHHDDIFIHVNLDISDKLFSKNKILSRLKCIPKVKKIFISGNDRKLGEVPGFQKLRNEIDFNQYDIATYIHSKGVTKSDNPNIKDWVELMRYYILERHDICIKAFGKGYALYGVRLSKFKGGKRINCYRFSDFWYAGNFVSVNLNMLRDEFLNTPVPQDYYGVEAFWGLLCDLDLAFNAHETPYSLHDHPYPPELYRDDL